VLRHLLTNLRLEQTLSGSLDSVVLDEVFKSDDFKPLWLNIGPIYFVGADDQGSLVVNSFKESVAKTLNG
jgi:hypothetical protein